MTGPIATPANPLVRLSRASRHTPPEVKESFAPQALAAPRKTLSNKD